MDIDFKLILFLGSAFAASMFLAVCVILISTSNQYPIIKRSKKEKCYLDPVSEKTFPFPSITEKSSVHLSVVIPAYNEETRLPPMLDECTEFLENRTKDSSFKYEIILVSDGSKDKTTQVAKDYCKKLGSEKFRILDLETNRGKGGAVRLGMQSARGALLLFADADGATKFSDFAKLESSIEETIKQNYLKNPEAAEDKLAIAVGSRAHLQDEAVAKRSFFRTILMYGFHVVVWLFAVRHVKDTQCGFKLLTRNAARLCFDGLHVERWAFDAELLYIAKYLDIPVTEIAVNWTEIEGSKLVPIWSWVQMGKDLFLIWLRYQIGAWKIKKPKED